MQCNAIEHRYLILVGVISTSCCLNSRRNSKQRSARKLGLCTADWITRYIMLLQLPHATQPQTSEARCDGSKRAEQEEKATLGIHETSTRVFVSREPQKRHDQTLRGRGRLRARKENAVRASEQHVASVPLKRYFVSLLDTLCEDRHNAVKHAEAIARPVCFSFTHLTPSLK